MFFLVNERNPFFEQLQNLAQSLSAEDVGLNIIIDQYFVFC